MRVSQALAALLLQHTVMCKRAQRLPTCVLRPQRAEAAPAAHLPVAAGAGTKSPPSLPAKCSVDWEKHQSIPVLLKQ